MADGTQRAADRPHGRNGAPAATVVFDAECAVCDHWVGFLAARDRRRRLAFVPAQAPAGRALMIAAGLDPTRLDTILLIDAAGCHLRSAAVLRAVALLGGGWRLAGALTRLPGPLRDGAYRGFARVRYRLFGRSMVCRLPSPDR